MPRKAKIGREDVIGAAAEIVRREGSSALSARSLAKELGVSTQPVYSLFSGMHELRAALREEAKKRYRAAIEKSVAGAKSRYEAFGLGFVRFAREERGFYRILFLEESDGDPFFDDIVAEMVSCYRMPEETARAFHGDMTVFSFGLASLVYAGAGLGEGEIEAAFRREFYALYALYFPDRPRFWER